jgi:hypothetical protein
MSVMCADADARFEAGHDGTTSEIAIPGIAPGAGVAGAENILFMIACSLL